MAVESNMIASSALSSDQEVYIADKLTQLSSLRLVAASLCSKMQLPGGHGLTAKFIRYKRMNVPLVPLTEGVDPANSTFTLESITVTLDQWGDVVTLTDVAILTTKHPLLQTAIGLLADNAQRVIDREVQIVWLTGTNVQFGDASVTSRRTVTAAMKMSDAILHRARISLIDGGAPPRSGPESWGTKTTNASGNLMGGGAFVAVCGPQVIGDLMTSSTSMGTWAAVATYNNAKALYNGEVGTWLGIRWVETNFIAKFTMLGNTTAAIASGGDGGITGLVVTAATDNLGTLTSSTTYFYKITRKDTTRGFEEAISIAHSTASAATGDTESFTFALPSTAGYVYNIYFDTVQAGGSGTDATLKLAAANQAAGTTVRITAVPTTGATAPDNVNTTGTPTIHPVYIHGAESCVWAQLQNLQTFVTKDEATTDNPLKLRRKIGYKFMAKTAIRDQTRMLRLEVASTY